MRKIVFLHPAHYEQSMGGAEYQISLLIEFLKKQSAHLEIYHIFEDNRTPIKNGLNIQLVPLKKIKLNKRFGDRWFIYKKRIVEELERIRPDVIYTRFFSSWSGIAADFARQNNCTHIWALASDNDVTRLQQRVSLLKPLDFIENKWVKKAFRSANYILTQNRYQQERIKTMYQREGILIRQSTEVCQEDTIVKPNSHIAICWIANLKAIKQPELFIELAERFKTNQSISFTMIGRPNKDYKELLQNAADRIPNFHYLGEIPNSEVNKQLSQSHILVNTSQYEGFSNTFVQAWMRKVVVVSLNSNPDDLLTDKEIGFVSRNPDELEKTIGDLVDNTDTIEKIGKKAYDYAQANHSYALNMAILTKLMGIDE